jgi:diamine N-acetyltransferase
MADAHHVPFRPQRYDLGLTHDRRSLTLEPMDAQNITSLAQGISAIGPWAHYGRTPSQIAARLGGNNDGLVRYQLVCNGVVSGAVVIWRDWLIGPNLQMLAVLPHLNRQGAGSAILSWFEAEARAHRGRNIWLCVSGFNIDAIRFYERHGFSRVAELPDVVQPDDTELLMRKLLVPDRSP